MIDRQVIALFVAICWASEMFQMGVVARRDPQRDQWQMLPERSKAAGRDKVGTRALVHAPRDEQWEQEEEERRREMTRSKESLKDNEVRVQGRPATGAREIQQKNWEKENEEREREMTRSIASLKWNNAGKVPGRPATGAHETQEEEWAREDADRQRYVQMKRGT